MQNSPFNKHLCPWQTQHAKQTKGKQRDKAKMSDKKIKISSPPPKKKRKGGNKYFAYMLICARYKKKRKILYKKERWVEYLLSHICITSMYTSSHENKKKW